MARATFANSILSLIATVLQLGGTPVSAATPPTSDVPLQDRIEAAKKAIDNVIGSQPESTTAAGKVAQFDDHHW